MKPTTADRQAAVRLFTHPRCLEHDPGPNHPESPNRLLVVLRALQQHFGDRLPTRQAGRLDPARLNIAHDPALIAALHKLQPASGRAHIDGDTLVSTGSWEAALHAAGAGVDAVEAILNGDCQRAFCAVRPPGHHATAAQAMGFCLFNNIAVAALHARSRGLGRVAIVDFDVHHGNGTQDIFWSDASVAYFSSHQSPLYPGTGTQAETGVGNIFNVGLPSGSGSIEFRTAWSQKLLPALTRFAPELLLISAGFDAHYLDPLAGLALTTEDFRWLTLQLCAISDRSAKGRVLSMLEGGYSPTALAECSVAHVEALMKAPANV